MTASFRKFSCLASGSRPRDDGKRRANGWAPRHARGKKAKAHRWVQDDAEGQSGFTAGKVGCIATAPRGFGGKEQALPVGKGDERRLAGKWS